MEKNTSPIQGSFAFHGNEEKKLKWFKMLARPYLVKGVKMMEFKDGTKMSYDEFQAKIQECLVDAQLTEDQNRLTRLAANRRAQNKSGLNF